MEQSDGVYFSHLRIGVPGYRRQHRKALSDGAFLLMFILMHHASNIQLSCVCLGYDVIYILIWSSDYRLLRLVVPNRYGSHLICHYQTLRRKL